MAIDLKPHAYGLVANPAIFRDVWARRFVAFLIDLLIIMLTAAFAAVFVLHDIPDGTVVINNPPMPKPCAWQARRSLTALEFCSFCPEGPWTRSHLTRGLWQAILELTWRMRRR